MQRAGLRSAGDPEKEPGGAEVFVSVPAAERLQGWEAGVYRAGWLSRGGWVRALVTLTSECQPAHRTRYGKAHLSTPSHPDRMAEGALSRLSGLLGPQQHNSESTCALACGGLAWVPSMFGVLVTRVTPAFLPNVLCTFIREQRSCVVTASPHLPPLRPPGTRHICDGPEASRRRTLGGQGVETTLPSTCCADAHAPGLCGGDEVGAGCTFDGKVDLFTPNRCAPVSTSAFLK